MTPKTSLKNTKNFLLFTHEILNLQLGRVPTVLVTSALFYLHERFNMIHSLHGLFVTVAKKPPLEQRTSEFTVRANDSTTFGHSD